MTKQTFRNIQVEAKRKEKKKSISAFIKFNIEGRGANVSILNTNIYDLIAVVYFMFDEVNYDTFMIYCTKINLSFQHVVNQTTMAEEF